MSRLKGLKAQLSDKAEAAPEVAKPANNSPGRDGKKLVGAWFSANVNKELRVLAAEEGTTIQALLGEALDLLMRARGKHPFGER